MRKKLITSLAACAVVGLTLCGVAACDDAPGEGQSGALAPVDVASISVREEIFYSGKLGITFDWEDVEGAETYNFTCNGVTLKGLTLASVTLQNYSSITMPANGVFNVSITASAYEHTDSAPVNYTYTVRGVELKGLNVTSFEDGVLKWNADPIAEGYIVSVNDGPSTTVTTNEYNINSAGVSGPLTVKISAAGDGLYTRTGPALTVNVNAAHTQLEYKQVTDFTVQDGVVSWKPMAGITKYKVVDIERNYKIVETTSFEYSESIPLYGVFPVSDNELIASAPVQLGDTLIPYLSGRGTSDQPYVIGSPIDFRAIDYYEAVYAERLKSKPDATKTYYMLGSDIDFNTVNALDEASNFLSVSQPFYGVFNGAGKELSNIRIRHKAGYWSMFDYIAPGGIVMNMKIVSPDIENEMIKDELPINASIATIAYKNNGSIADITVTDAAYKAAGGEVAGICWQNNGIVQRCTVGGQFEQRATGQSGQACYEMAGIVAENYGSVNNNTVTTLEIRGTSIPIKDPEPGSATSYNNVRCAGGIVAVNRSNASVTGNTYQSLTMTNVLEATSNEFGGIVAYNAPNATVAKGGVTLGTFKHNGTTVSGEVGRNGALKGTVIGKNEGRPVQA